MVQAPLCAAVTRPGTAWARAPKTRSTTRWQVESRECTAAGATQFSTLPGVAVTRSGRARPAFGSTSGSTTARAA